MGLTPSKNTLGNIIGQGGFGTVYRDTRNSNHVIKIITKEYDCNKGENEFEIQRKVYECMKNLKTTSPIKIKVPKPIEFKRVENMEYKCRIVMEKIPPLYDNNMVQLAFSFPFKKTGYTQMKYGWLVLTSLGNPRGVFFDAKDLEKYLYYHNVEYNTKYNVEQILYTIGMAIGYITKHCTDAKDIEYFLSKNKENELVLYLADFGMSNLLGSENYDLDHILFDIVLPDEETPHYKEFIEGIESVGNPKLISIFNEK
jgi:hypothetical protein